MEKKKYQIFVSSTYEDLKEERKAVIEQILNMGHLPVGMELFVASDDEQFEYIKRIINNCDYYVLILGGRYGSISPNTGISYTEMEYNYAVEKNIPVLVFPYIQIDELPLEKKDSDLTQIFNFTDKVTKSRMRKSWKTKEELCLNVMNSLYKNIEENPQRGWIRPDEYDNSELLTEINELRKKNLELEKEINDYKKVLNPTVSNLANMDELYELHFKYETQNGFNSRNATIVVTWNQLFSYIAPKLISPTAASSFKYMLDSSFINKVGSNYYKRIFVEDDDAQTIKIQFFAMGLIKVFSGKSLKGGINEFIELTPKGLNYLKQIKTIKTSKNEIHN